MAPRTRGGPFGLSRLLAWLALLTAGVDAAGGGIWILGPQVEAQPKLIFMLFVIVVLLTMAMEWAKHKAEHATHGTHRGAALNAIFSELMMIGVISFLMILAGEFGATQLRIETPCEDPLMKAPEQTDTVATVKREMSVLEHLAAPRHRFSETTVKPREPAVGTPSPEEGDDAGHVRRSAVELGGSGAGEEAETKCYIGVTMLLLEYAHLVLFVMGICYGVFIQGAFIRRNQYVEEIRLIENKKTLAECNDPVGVWDEPTLWCVSGMGSTSGWQRTVLAIRNAVVIHCKDRIEEVASPVEYEIELANAELKGLPRPAKRALPHEATTHFCFARFVHKAQAEVLVELVHAPPVVWLGIVAMSGVNLVYFSGISLPRTLLCVSFLMPLMAVGVVLRMGAQLRSVVRGAVGHPLINAVNYHEAVGESPEADAKQDFVVIGKQATVGREWAAGETTPWETLTGCCEDGSTLDFLDLNDPGALKVQIQMIVFSSCFFLGQLCMLMLMIIDELGVGGFIGILLIAICPLYVVLPKAILLFTLTHTTFAPPRTWLQAALALEDSETESSPAAVSRLHAFLDKTLGRRATAPTSPKPYPNPVADSPRSASGLTHMAAWSPQNLPHGQRVSFVGRSLSNGESSAETSNSNSHSNGIPPNTSPSRPHVLQPGPHQARPAMGDVSLSDTAPRNTAWARTSGRSHSERMINTSLSSLSPLAHSTNGMSMNGKHTPVQMPPPPRRLPRTSGRGQPMTTIVSMDGDESHGSIIDGGALPS